MYVNKKSNHPLSILKKYPRFHQQSAFRNIFRSRMLWQRLAVYQEALNKTGYNYNLSYNDRQRSRTNHPRNILWCNPHFSKNVKTNVGKCFLSLFDQNYPKSHPLYKVFISVSICVAMKLSPTTKLCRIGMIVVKCVDNNWCSLNVVCFIVFA